MLNARTRAWIEESCGTKIVNAVRLQGGLSSTIHRVDLHKSAPVIIRQITESRTAAATEHSDFDVQQREDPEEIINEARTLEMLCGRAGAPRLITSDPHGKRCGFATSLQTLIPGSLNVHPAGPLAWAEQLADATNSIAALTLGQDQLSTLPFFSAWWPNAMEPPRWSTDPVRWERVAENLRSGLPDGKPQLVHRDLHPANILFGEDGQWTGTVDWVHGCIGPIEVDVARCRVQIAFLTDRATADHYLAACQSRRTLSGYDPRWDALVAIELSPWIREIAATYRRVGSSVTTAHIANALNDFVSACA